MNTLIALFLSVLAQDPTTQAPTITPDATIALGKKNDRLTVPVLIAGAGPYAFIIDTGAQRTVVSNDLAVALRLADGRAVRVTAMTGTSPAQSAIIPSLKVGGITSERIEAPVLRSVDLGALGMLGIDALQGQIVAFDFDAGSMTVRRSTKRDRGSIAVGDIVVRARNLFGQLVVTDAHYRTQRVKVVIDTGSAVSIGNAALRAQVGTLHRPEQINLTSVTGGSFSADYTQIPHFELGSIGFENLPVAFNDAEPFRRFGLTDQPALLLGMDALRLFRRVEIDFANREVRFSARTAIR